MVTPPPPANPSTAADEAEISASSNSQQSQRRSLPSRRASIVRRESDHQIPSPTTTLVPEIDSVSERSDVNGGDSRRRPARSWSRQAQQSSSDTSFISASDGFEFSSQTQPPQRHVNNNSHANPITNKKDKMEPPPFRKSQLFWLTLALVTAFSSRVLFMICVMDDGSCKVRDEWNKTLSNYFPGGCCENIDLPVFILYFSFVTLFGCIVYQDQLVKVVHLRIKCLVDTVIVLGFIALSEFYSETIDRLSLWFWLVTCFHVVALPNIVIVVENAILYSCFLVMLLALSIRYIGM